MGNAADQRVGPKVVFAPGALLEAEEQPEAEQHNLVGPDGRVWNGTHDRRCPGFIEGKQEEKCQRPVDEGERLHVHVQVVQAAYMHDQLRPVEQAHSQDGKALQ